MACVDWLTIRLSMAREIRIGPPVLASEFRVRVNATSAIVRAWGRK